MNKRLKKITLILVGLFVAYIIGSSIFTVVTGYSVEFGNSDEYKFLFKEKYHNALDTISVKDYRKPDYYTKFRMDNYYLEHHKIHD